MMYQMNMKRGNNCRRPMPGLMDDPVIRTMLGMDDQRRPRPMGMRVDAYETDDAFVLEAELPGVKLADITLTAENDVLTIAADLNRHAENRKGCLLHERRSGRVERRFSLEGVRQEAITAASADGVLTVTLPKVKPEGAKALRHIPINAPEAAPALPEGAATEVGEVQ